MMRLTSKLEIGNYTFPFSTNIEVVSSWEQLTDTCVVLVPKKLRAKKDGQYSDVITAGPDALWKRNEPVKVYAGYDDFNDLIFEGVLTKIVPRMPLEFSCEDYMYLLKQISVKKFSKPGQIKLLDILNTIIPKTLNGIPITIKAIDFSITNPIIEKASVAEFLNFLKQRFGLTAYFRGPELNVGFAYSLSTLSDITSSDIVEFAFQNNIIDDSALSYIREDDVQLRVSAVSIEKTKRTEVEVGDPDGETRTMYYYNVGPVELKKLANEALQKLKYEGFRGSFTTFLQPMVKHGQAVKLIDPLIPDRSGVYLVRRVVRTAGSSGGRQEITLDRKIS